MKHPIEKIPTAHLIHGLLWEVKRGNVRAIDHNDLTLFCYSPDCIYNSAWNTFSLLARGLIIDLANDNIVALPFPKFFNHFEKPIKPTPPLLGREKIDGSLGIVYYWNGWQVATKGCFDSPLIDAAKSMLVTDELDERNTYLVEIVHPEFSNVIPYQHRALYMLGAYNLDTFEFSIPKLSGFLYPCEIKADINFFESQCDSLPYTQEGYVVIDGNGQLFKYKSVAYMNAHNALSKLSHKSIWKLYRGGEDKKSILSMFPTHIQPDVLYYCEEVEKSMEDAISDLQHDAIKMRGYDNKEIATQHMERLTEVGRSFIFDVRKEGFWDNLKKPGPLRNKLFRYVRVS